MLSLFFFPISCKKVLRNVQPIYNFFCSTPTDSFQRCYLPEFKLTNLEVKSPGCHDDPVQGVISQHRQSHLFFTLPNQWYFQHGIHIMQENPALGLRHEWPWLLLLNCKCQEVVFSLLEVDSSARTLWFIGAMQAYYAIRS